MLQAAGTALLNGCFAWLAGAWLARRWLGASADAIAPVLRRCAILATVLALAGGCAALLAAAAMMGGVGLQEGTALVLPMAGGTAYGRASLLAAAALVAGALLQARGRASWLAAAALLVFAAARASVSHAAEDGMLSAAYLIGLLHLMAIGAWAGAVALAAWVVLPAGHRSSAYLARLSQGATLALAVLVASGAFNSWQRLSAPSDLVSHPYGIVLSCKLLLVLPAVLLGAYNRFAGFPAWADGRGRAVAVLRAESLLLTGALLAAAVMTSSQPPA